MRSAVYTDTFRHKATAYAELMKIRLSFLVTFSAAMGYLLAAKNNFNTNQFLCLLVGAMFLSGSSAVFNQVLEKEWDAKMNRTKNRPLPALRLTQAEAVRWGVLCFFVSILFLLQTNVLTVALSVLSFVLYVFCYTPLKRVGPVAVFVGAIPGALPPLLGWTAAANEITIPAIILLGIQFIWQFPHFWAIAWVSHDDYQRAGFKLLPSSGGKNMQTAFQIMVYTLFLIPFGLMPALFGFCGIRSAVVATICGCFFAAQAFVLMKNGDEKSARRIMFTSFFYLPIVQIAFWLDAL